MNRKDSILAEVRRDAYRNGFSQAAQLTHDDAFEAGRLEALHDTRGEYRWWWAFGLLCGVGASAIIGAFF